VADAFGSLMRSGGEGDWPSSPVRDEIVVTSATPPEIEVTSATRPRAGAHDGQSPPAPVGGDPYPPELLAALRGRPIGELDLVFLVDETGSMGSYIGEVQRRLLHLIAALERSPLCRSLRLGLVSYRDHPPEDSTFVVRAVPLTEEVAKIRDGVASLHAQGGGDGPEAVTDGLHALLGLDWRPRAARTVVWIGDAPPHGVEPSGDGFPKGCPCGRHWFAQAESCREMGIVVHAVGCQPALAMYRGAEEVYRTVATTARGLFIGLDDAHRLIPLITGMAESDLDRQRIDEAVAAELQRRAPELADLDEQDRIARLTRSLQQERVRPRTLDLADPAAPAMRFRDLTDADVEASLESLRRQGRAP
jgi:hypothetical protein